MRHVFHCAIVLSVAAFGAAAAEQAADRPLSRSLTVEQAAIYDVQPPASPASAGADELEVLAWVDRPDYTYASGEDVRVFVETNKDAYVTVLNVDPAGETTVLFPNRYQSDNYLTANRALQVPDRGSSFRIVVGGNVGAELLKVIASTEPIPLFEARQLGEDAGPFQVVRARPAGLARSLTVAMTNPPSVSAPAVSPGSTRPRPASGSTAAAGVTPIAASTEWAMCHQAVTTVPTLSTDARRTRSLTVQRTQDSSGSVTCEEVR